MDRRMGTVVGLFVLALACLPEGVLPGSTPTAPPLIAAPTGEAAPPVEAAPTATSAPPVEALPSPTPMPPLRNPRAQWAVVEERSWSVDDLGGFPLSLSPDGRWLAMTGEGLCLHPTDDPTQSRCYRPEGESPSGVPWGAVWSPDGETLLFHTSTSHAGTWWMLDVAGGEPRRLLDTDGWMDLAWSPDGEYLAVAGGGAITVGPPGAAPEVPVARYEGLIAGIAWADASMLIYGVRQDDEFVLWRVSTLGGEPAEVWRAPDYAENLRVKDVSPDGTTASLWLVLVDLEHGEEIPVREKHGFSGLEWSLNGRWWLYAYPVSGEPTSHLALRPARSPETEEQVVWTTDGHNLRLVDWAGVNGLVLLLDPAGNTVWLLRLVVRQALSGL